jgi:hypothetical protein
MFREGGTRTTDINIALNFDLARVLSKGPGCWGVCCVEVRRRMFIKRTGASVVYLITYVDDMIIASASLPEIEAFKKYLSGVFEVTDLDRTFPG